MKDLTQGPIPRLLIAMAVPIAVGLIVQTLYLLVDLYFVSRLGPAAIAGVGAAANVGMLVLALTQMLGVGAAALISHAAGRKDQPEANLLFNQALLLSALVGALVLIVGYAGTHAYMAALAADPATVAAGRTYLYWYLPGLAAQFAIVAMGAALRGTGIVKPTMVVQLVSLALNVILAPVLIAGIGTGRPLGVAGAGLASTIAIFAGVALMTAYFFRLETYVHFSREALEAHWAVWRRLFAIGVPAGGEFALVFVYTGFIYSLIRGFGADAQAGFGIAMRVMQALFLPAMALAFAVQPIAGQNFGARRPERVREAFSWGGGLSILVMLALTLICQWRAGSLIAAFTSDPHAIAVGTQFLKVISWNFVGNGLIFTCSSMFQGLGNTWPSLISSASRLLTFVLPALYLASRPGFALLELWYLSVTTIGLQTLFSLALLARELKRRSPLPAAAPA
jgi:putative MATE family efflux protein